ncbi:hypothetical protein FJT64_020237 [Amphibalanus amphitrite]|uniref:Uncharacterized protein n=1 Tax=Amphibalanus amphitrite TaxID=1232801 RepID=A0A6A4X2D3_AMPAM|nr:hypothetical protein FJT64_020237 [Amphibalanus amphitrite]
MPSNRTKVPPPGELHCSRGGSWCPPGETCGGPVCGPGPRCCDETVDAFLQRPVLPEPPIPPSAVKGAPPIDSTESVREPPSTDFRETANKPPPPPRRCRPGTKCIVSRCSQITFPASRAARPAPPDRRAEAAAAPTRAVHRFRWVSCTAVRADRGALPVRPAEVPSAAPGHAAATRPSTPSCRDRCSPSRRSCRLPSKERLRSTPPRASESRLRPTSERRRTSRRRHHDAVGPALNASVSGNLCRLNGGQ